jgi:hypothetical protein
LATNRLPSRNQSMSASLNPPTGLNKSSLRSI